jgi:hypothetical protein
MIMRLCLLVMFCVITPAMADGLASAPFADLAGSWHCDGTMSASGAAISSNVRFVWDDATKTLIKHHDDVPPNSYHAIEFWAAGKTGLEARIADSFGGVRDFKSAGWVDNRLTWQNVVNTPRYERFVYTKLDPATLRIDWNVSADGVTYKTGDTLTCRKA